MSSGGQPPAGRGRGGGRGNNNQKKPNTGGRGDAASKTTTNSQPQQQSSKDDSGNKKGNAGGSQNNKNPGRGKGGRGQRGRGKRNNREANKGSSLEQLGNEMDEERLQKKAEDARRAEARKREAEEKAVEEARKALEKKQEDTDQALRDSIAVLKGIVETVQQHETYRAAMSEKSLQTSRKSFADNKKKLKTDLKKCTAFVKKIKSGSAWSMKPADIVKDVASLNLSRYVEEVVTAIFEAKPKFTDIPVIVALSIAMHERYPEYLSNLVSSLWNVVLDKATTSDAAKSRRVYVRLLTEFLLCGLVSETKNLQKIIVEATGAKGDGNYAVSDANLVVAFSKQAGHEIFGVTASAVKSAVKHIQHENGRSTDPTVTEKGVVVASSTLIQSGMEMVEQMEKILAVRAVDPTFTSIALDHCTGAFHSLSESLLQSHLTLQKMEKRCAQDKLVLGSLPEAREKGLADARKLKESLLKCVESLSDILAQPLPQLEEDEEENNANGPGIEVLTAGAEGENVDFGPFDDEETRAFYSDIPDYLTTVPPALLGLSPDAIEAKKIENAAKYGDAADSADELDYASVSEILESAVEEDAEQVEEGDGAVNDNEEEGKETPRYKLTVILAQELPESHGREQIDDMSERFCSNHGSSKSSRKRLSKALIEVPYARLDLLPFYSRMAATVDRVWSDIASPLLESLEQQFHGQAKFKKNQHIESRMRTARYIGELTKFRVAPPIIFLRCMRRCLDDFSGNNVDIACCLLESCGRFLYKLKHTTAKVTGLMEAMTRIGKTKNLDERLQSLIKAAFHSVRPPKSGTRRLTKEYPPLESYLRYLLMVRLEPAESVVTEVVKQIIRLPWSDPASQSGSLVNRILLKACRKGRYKTIEAVASVVANLRRRGIVEVPTRLVDSVLEELRWALEHPNFRDQQRTITYARLLGELYSQGQVSAKLVIAQLYEFVDLGHEISPALREASKKLAENDLGQALPEYNSSVAVAQTIAEDEEMPEEAMEPEEVHTKPPQPVAVSEHSKYDPRVYSDIDPPAAAYRIKLVCTLLEVSAQHIVTKANLTALQNFLTALQRYLFTKPILPTEVEFSLLDAFDAVDSQWKNAIKSNASNKDSGFIRYGTWLEAHNATVAVEEAEAVDAAKKRSDLEAIADNSKSIVDIMTRVLDPNLDEDSVSHMDEDDDDGSLASNSVKGSVISNADDSQADFVQGDEGQSYHSDAENSDDEGNSSDDNETDGEDSADSDEFGTDDEEDFDEEAYSRQLEEEAFERELRRITMDALEKGKSASRKIVASDMISGSQVVKKKVGERVEDGESPAPSFLSNKPGVSVQLLRKGTKGKLEAKELIVPMETNLAKAATRKDTEAARERDEIKLRVLQYDANLAEAELTGGSVYLEQAKLEANRNKTLSMDVIDRNFGTTRGDLHQPNKPKPSSGPDRGGVRMLRGGPPGRGGRGRGRNASGRGLV